MDLRDVPVGQGGAELAALLLCPLVRGGCPSQRWGQQQVSTGFTASPLQVTISPAATGGL